MRLHFTGRSTCDSPARVVGLTLGSLALLASAAVADTTPSSRTVELTTTIQVDPHAAPARVWVPVPLEAPVQRVRTLTVDAPGTWTLERDTLHGNRFLYMELPPATAAVRLAWRATVTRETWSGPQDDAPTSAQLAEYRRPLPLVPVGGPVLGPRAESALRGGSADSLSRGRRLFDYVLDEMTYDKRGAGWGRGDALYACDTRTGNCTDFHALFNGLARTADMPARFTMGFSLPPQPAGAIDGYHCWTAFWIEGRGWVPADISEADKRPGAAPSNYYARLDANRIALSRGRDLVLQPPQAGPRLNYAYGPYVETAGEPVELTHTTRTYRDVDTAAGVLQTADR